MENIKNLSTELLTALNYHIGFTGYGSTAFDTEPEKKLTETEIEEYKDLIEEEKKYRQEAYHQSVLEVTGEDINEKFYT